MHFNTNERPQQAIRHNRGASSMGISISSGGDLETLSQQVSPHNHVASSIKSSTSSGGDLETLAQQALQCNCVVAAYIGNKDLETLTQQALQHDLMASFFTQSTVAKHSSQQSTVHQAEQPDALLAPPKTLPQQALPRNGVASSIKSSSSSCGDLQTLAQQGLQCNCVVPAYISNKDLETLTLQALQHNLMASSLTQRTTQSTVAQQSSQEATVLQATRPEAELACPNLHQQWWRFRNLASASPSPRNHVASTIKNSTSSAGDLETLAQQALTYNCVVAAYIGNKDLETLTLQALQHDLMASSFTQSTVVQHSSQESTVLQARQPEAVLTWTTRSWGCCRAVRRCSSILMRGPNKPSGITEGPLPWGSPSAVSSSSSCGDLQTLAQQGLQCNCVVPAYIGNEDLETLTLQALQHDLMASSLTERTIQSTVAQQSSQEATVLQARQPEAVLRSHNHVTSSMGIFISSGGDLETLPQQALQCNCVVAAYIGNKDLETLILQALHHDLMASSFTQRTTQSTMAQQSSQEATVLQARQPEAVLAWPISSWGCLKAARRCISILMKGPNQPPAKPRVLLRCHLHQQSWGFRNLASGSPPA
ncbi:hypothetical protein AAY473_037256 [Plecturocebus cupreus]